MNWIFNSSRFTEFSGRQKEILQWEQKRNFSGKPGDLVLFYFFDENQKLFTHEYKIDSVNIVPAKSTNNELKLITIEFSLIKGYTEKKDFQDYIYSFPRVKYFDKMLWRHFNRKFYRISIPEFNAVDKDEIFVSRTILGSSLNSMHPDHRIAFSKYLVGYYPEIVQNIFDNDAILNIFLDYLDYAIIQPSEHLQEGYNFLSELLNNQVAEDLSFAEPDESKSQALNLIKNQTINIKEHMSSLIGLKNLWNENQIQGEKQKFFKTKFSNKGLPIDLKK